MVRSELVMKLVVVGLLASLSGSGCGGGAEEIPPEIKDATKNLRTISNGYVKGTEAMDHPPRNKEELVPYIHAVPDLEDPDAPEPEIDMEQLFRSPNDGEKYVIHWGVDFRDFRINTRTMPVLAYEKVGKDGKRVVAQGRYVRIVTDDDFVDLPFPPGFRAP
jgi:hypothetical protein